MLAEEMSTVRHISLKTATSLNRSLHSAVATWGVHCFNAELLCHDSISHWSKSQRAVVSMLFASIHKTSGDCFCSRCAGTCCA